MKTKPNADTKNEDFKQAINSAAISAQDNSINAEKLAMLAATVARNSRMPANKVVEYAYELWSESRKLLSTGRRYQLELAFRGVPVDENSFEKKTASIPLPKKFPATFQDFLRLIVGARTSADSLKRYRDFTRKLLKTEGSSKPVESAIERDKKNGFPHDEDWKLCAMQYLHWWKNERSDKAAISARAKKHPKET